MCILFIYLYKVSSFNILCNNVSELVFVISPVIIADSYIFRATSLGISLPILIKLCSFKCVFISFIGFFF